MDLVLMNKINNDGWVAINCIPTAVHTIAGALVGKLFLERKEKIKPMLIWALVCLYCRLWTRLGWDNTDHQTNCNKLLYAWLRWAGVCWNLSFCYWWIDDKRPSKQPEIFYDSRDEFNFPLSVF